MNYRIPAQHAWQPALPPPTHTAVLRPNAGPFNPKLPIAEWAKLSLHFHADPVQAEILNQPTHRLLLCATRQWGKSTVAAIKALHLAYSKPGALILFKSESLKQSAELLRKFRVYATRLTGLTLKGDRLHPGSIVLPNGSRILALPQSLNALRSYSAVDLIVVDDAAFVNDGAHKALTSMLAVSNGQLWLLSHANTQSGEFYKLWSAASPAWSKWTITALECPRITKEFLAAERLAKGEMIFNQEYMCRFAVHGDNGINRKKIEAAFHGDYPAMQFPD